jgi:tetratricopeptide (TPR) repeat protein
MGPEPVIGIGQIHAQQVCKYLENNEAALIRCLEGIKEAGLGQLARSEGRPQKALDHFLLAEREFDAIPAATFLLGIVRADIAAAHGDLRNWAAAARYARAGIDIARNDSAFALTEANAHMTLANALGFLEDLAGAQVEYDRAEQIYKTLTGVREELNALRRNRASILGSSQSKRLKWQFWRK